MGIFFGDTRHKIYESTYREHVRGALLSRGLSTHDLSIVDMVFNEALFGSVESQRGIDAQELAHGIKFLTDNHSKYGFSIGMIKVLEDEMNKWLAKY